MARGPRCFKWRPVELLFLEFLMALMVCCSVMTVSSDGSFRVLRSMILLLACVLCLMVLANCLLNRVAFCSLLMAVLLKLDGDIGGVFRLFVAEGTDSLPEFVCVVPVFPVTFKILPPELGFMFLDLFVDALVKFL